MRIASLFLVLTPAALGFASAYADEVKIAKAEHITFASVDRNGDHRISKTEAGPYKLLIDRFAYIDTDGDGFISQTELNATLTANAAN